MENTNAVNDTVVNCNTNNTKCVTELKRRLTDGLQILPNEFSLTPVRFNKCPYRNNWQNEDTLSRDFIAKEINQGEAKGYGLRTGTISGGMVAVDADGEAAHAKLNEISQGNLPNTVAFTSGKIGRCQYLYRIPEQYWEGVKTRKINTGVKNDEGKFQQLELRWNGCQSVLPPSVHPETGEYKWVNSPKDTAIAEAPQWLIEAMLKEQQPAKAKHKSNSAKPKLDIETKSQHQLVREFNLAIEYINALKPERADNYDDWLAVGMALHSLANDPDLDPETSEEWNEKLFEVWDTWSQQSDNYGGTEERWTGFSETKGRTMASLGQMAKEDGWVKKAQETESYIASEVRRILELNASAKEEKEMLGRCQSESLVSLSFFYSIVDDVRAEIELEQSREYNKGLLEALLSSEERRFDISEALPEGMASTIKRFAKKVNKRPEAFLHFLLGGLSGQFKTKTRLMVNEATDWAVAPNLYMALVAPSGEMKSVLLREMVGKPIRKLQGELNKKYNEEKAGYDKAKQQSKNGGGEVPEQPILKAIMTNDLNSEGLRTRLAQFPDDGLTIIKDELAGFFKSANQYRGGAGGDEEKVLEWFDPASSDLTLRAGGVVAATTERLISLVGGIQPKVLAAFLKDCEDSNGNWARFLLCRQERSASKIDEEGIRENFDLTELYRKVQNLPITSFRCCDEARRIFITFNHVCEEQKILDETPEGIKNYLAKLWGTAPKLALNLHVIWYCSQGLVPPQEIPPEIALAAVKLSVFYLSQTVYVYGEVSGGQDSLSGNLRKVLKAAEKTEWLRASTFQQNHVRSNKGGGKSVTTKNIEQWFIELGKMNYGKTRKTQTNVLEFKAWKLGERKRLQSPLDFVVEKYKRFNELKNLPSSVAFGKYEIEPTFSDSPKFSSAPESVIPKYSDAEKEFEFDSSPLNPADLQPATPKGADAQLEQAVAGVSEAVEAEAVKVEEPTTKTSFQKFLGGFLEKLKSATASQSDLEQADACDREEEPEVVTVDGKTFSIGEVVKRTEHDIAVKVKVLGKGLIGNSQTEGFVVEYLELKIDPDANAEGVECNHIQGGEWIVSPGQVRTTSAEFLSKLTDEDLTTPDNTEQEKRINIQGADLIPGAMIYYKPSTNEAAYVELLGESENGEIIILCRSVALEDSKCPFRVGDMAWVERSTLSTLPF